MMIEDYEDAILFHKLIRHKGHKIECVAYGSSNKNVSLECKKCNEVILEYELDGSEEEQNLLDDAK